MDYALSERIQSLSASATLRVAQKARALQERGVHVISLAAGEPDFDTPEHVKQAAIEALQRGDTKYPLPVSGKTPLRGAICDYLRRYCSASYTPDQICVTVGAKDALYMAFAALLDPGDEVIIPVPYWVSYPELVRLHGGRPVFVQGDEAAGGRISAAQLAAALTPRTRMLVLNSPSNPSGAVYSRREFEALAEVLRPTRVLVASDEIYHRLTFGPNPFVSFAAIEGMIPRTIVVNGMSKSFAMTGWRLGFAAGPAPIIEAMARLQGQTTSGAPSFVQTAAVTALSGDQTCVERMCEAYRIRGERMCRALNSIPGVRCAPPHGAFYCFADVSGTYPRLGVSDADAFADVALDRAHVALVSGAAFGAPRFARLSFAASDAEIDEALERLRALLSG